MAKKKGLLDKVKEAVTGVDEDVVTETVPEATAPEVDGEVKDPAVEEIDQAIVEEAAAAASAPDADQLYSLEEAARITELRRRGFTEGKIQQLIEDGRTDPA